MIRTVYRAQSLTDFACGTHFIMAEKAKVELIASVMLLSVMALFF